LHTPATLAGARAASAVPGGLGGAGGDLGAKEGQESLHS